jgi:hypothetical protein
MYNGEPHVVSAISCGWMYLQVLRVLNTGWLL